MIEAESDMEDLSVFVWKEMRLKLGHMVVENLIIAMHKSELFDA